MKIKSISDVITNSSSEVFVFKLDDPYYQRFRELVPQLDFEELRNESDIRRLIMSEDYYGWLYGDQQSNNGPIINPRCDLLSDYDFREYCELSGKSSDEIWDFIKDGYSNLSGYAYSSIETDCCGSEFYKRISDALSLIYREKVKNHLSQFNEGDILDVPFNIYGESPKIIKIQLCNKEDYSMKLLEPSIIPDYVKDNWLCCCEILESKKHED